jgi:glycosyltransferase involved in cell wall biosynthesis
VKHSSGFPAIPPFRSETAWEDATFAANLVRRIPLSGFDATVTCSFPFTHWALRRNGHTWPAHLFVTQNGDWPAVQRQGRIPHVRVRRAGLHQSDYAERNRDRWNCAVIPNGVDVERFTPGPGKREAFGLPLDKPVVLMVSALIASKRVLDGIRAVAALEDAVLVVAGDGPLRDDVTRLADQLLPDRFRRVSLSASEMPDLYRSADVFLHLSLLESFGNVFLESWASGVAGGRP